MLNSVVSLRLCHKVPHRISNMVTPYVPAYSPNLELFLLFQTRDHPGGTNEAHVKSILVQDLYIGLTSCCQLLYKLVFSKSGLVRYLINCTYLLLANSTNFQNEYEPGLQKFILQNMLHQIHFRALHRAIQCIPSKS